MKRRTTQVLAGTIGLSLALAACGSSSKASTGSNSTAKSASSTAATSNPATATSLTAFGGMSGLVAAAKKEGTLNVITLPSNWANYGTIMKDFTAEYGIRINDANPEGSSQDEINAMKSLKGQSRAPDVLDMGTPFAITAATDGLLAPYKVASWSSIPTVSKAANGDWYGDYGGFVSIGYNRARRSRPPPGPPPTTDGDLRWMGSGSPSRPGAPAALVTQAAVDRLLAPLQAKGGLAYLGEPVTQLDHALQAAARADEAGAPPALVVAALLHDVGWLLGAADEDHAGRSATYLEPWCPPAVAEPVRLHVEAKRWLCSTSPAYYDLLSEASKRTLALQGGTMSPAEAAAFEAGGWAADAVLLRRWDDEAKLPGRSVPGLDHWRPLLGEVVAGP